MVADQIMTVLPTGFSVYQGLSSASSCGVSHLICNVVYVMDLKYALTNIFHYTTRSVSVSGWFFCVSLNSDDIEKDSAAGK